MNERRGVLDNFWGRIVQALQTFKALFLGLVDTAQQASVPVVVWGFIEVARGRRFQDSLSVPLRVGQRRVVQIL